MVSLGMKRVSAIAAFAIAAILSAGVATSASAGSAFAAMPDAEKAASELTLASTQADGAGAYLAEAQAKYGVADDRVLQVNDATELASQLKAAQRLASPDAKCIVYLPSGTYEVGETLSVPANVVLVGESDSVITPSAAFDILVKINGSVYGGTFDCNHKNKTGLKFLETNYANDNGRIDKAIVTESDYYGIVAIHPNSKNSVVSGCKVTKCKASGISILDAAYIKLIENSDFSNNGTAGINLSHADVGTIRKCTINNNGDKAISTNSDPVNSYKQPGCTIKSVTGCTIKGNKTNGVYIKPKCKLLSFTNNTLINNKDGLSAVGVTEYGTKGASVIKNVVGNTFKGNGNAQIRAAAKGAVVYVGKNNKILNGPAAGIAARNKGKVVVNGANNQIKKNKGAGLNASGASVITVSGKKNVIANNGRYAVYCIDKSKVTLNKVTRKGAIYSRNKGKVVVK